MNILMSESARLNLMLDYYCYTEGGYFGKARKKNEKKNQNVRVGSLNMRVNTIQLNHLVAI